MGKLAQGGEGYYLEAVASGQEDYYLGSGEAPGRWVGRGAAAMGLAGEVEGDALRRLLAGLGPAGELLARGPASGRPRLPGYDLTFSAPKSVSLLHALGPAEVRRAVTAAHKAAAEAGLAYLEAQAARLRRGHDGLEVVPAIGLAGAAFRHRVSRAEEPALHTHIVIPNLGTSEDGRSGALDGRALYRHARTAGYLYQAELRHRLTRELGLAWGPVVSGAADVAEVPRRVLRAFSTRRRDIEAELDAREAFSVEARRLAALVTRGPKRNLPVHELRAEWRRRAAALGFERAEMRALLGRERPHEMEPVRLAEAERKLAGPRGLTEEASSFTGRDVVRAFATTAEPAVDAAVVLERAERFLGSAHVVELGPDRAGERRYGTPELQAIERGILESAERRRHARAGLARERAVEAAVRRRPALSPEQAAMVRRLCRDGDGVAVVAAPAGAGKTYALDPAREAWERSGHRVIGVALAARAAQGLQAGSGIPSQTVAGLLRELEDPRCPGLGRKSVLVVDEAGMVGTRDLARLVEATERAGAKLVLVGDPAQLPEIGAGGAFRGLSARLEPIRLTENRRQREAWERAALRLVRAGRGEEAVAQYARYGRITVADTADEVRERLVADWWRDRGRGGESLMLAARRRDAADLSGRARALLVAAGEVAGPSLSLPAGGEVAAGDRVVALRNSRDLGVHNGLRGTVKRVDVEEGSLTMRADDGGERVLSREYLRAGHLAHAYALTLHKAQGATVDRAYVLGPPEGAGREWGYTALSRAREGTRVYLVGGEDLLQELAAEHGGRHQTRERDPLSELGRDLGRSRAKEMSLELGP